MGAAHLTGVPQQVLGGPPVVRRVVRRGGCRHGVATPRPLQSTAQGGRAVAWLHLEAQRGVHEHHVALPQRTRAAARRVQTRAGWRRASAGARVTPAAEPRACACAADVRCCTRATRGRHATRRRRGSAQLYRRACGSVGRTLGTSCCLSQQCVYGLTVTARPSRWPRWRSCRLRGAAKSTAGAPRRGRRRRRAGHWDHRAPPS